MKHSTTTLSVLGAAALAVLAGSATANNRHNRDEVARAFLSPLGEVPVVSSNAKGTFRAVIDEDKQEVTFKLTYEGLEGGNTLFAHIHLGERHTNGGVMVFLCGGGTKPDPCPNINGTVEGTLVPADVQAILTQQVAEDGFDEFLQALRTPGLSYVNVHTTASPGGEVRGQIFVR